MTSNEKNTFFRQFGALIYDLFILIAVLAFATLPVTMLSSDDYVHSGTIWFQAYLTCIMFFFYGWFWTHGGQTIGMRAWRIRLVSDNTLQDPNWAQALRRFVIAPFAWLIFGIGSLWQFLPINRSWQDMASDTHIIYDPDKKT
ncbi:MAG: RDD family protein [bacterium]